jgi:hypothetical protein
MSRCDVSGWRVALFLLLTCVASGRPAFAQTTSGPTERFFKLDWHVEHGDGGEVAIVGSLRNDYLYSLRRLQLQVQTLDEAGRIGGETVAAVDRELRPGESTTFRIPVRAPGTRYAVLVHAFEFGERESP